MFLRKNRKAILVSLLLSICFCGVLAHAGGRLDRTAVRNLMDRVKTSGAQIQNIGPVVSECAPTAISVSAGSDTGWQELPRERAQCTKGAKDDHHNAKIRIRTFERNSTLSLAFADSNGSESARSVLIKRGAHFVGNGPIYRGKGKGGAEGYLKSGGTLLAKLDCVKFRSNPDNVGRENSVFVRYRKRSIDEKTQKPVPGKYSEDWQYRVVSTDFLCGQLQPKEWVEYSQTRDGLTAEQIATRKKWEVDGEDLVEGNQIDLAIQSGPAVLRNSVNVLAGYNSGKDFRSYIGVNTQGKPLVVEIQGNMGSYCVGEYVKSMGVKDLLHLDSNVSDVAFRESDGSVSGYPTANPNSSPASWLVIQ